MEMIGTGPGGKGAVWVAMRIPDGSISAYANGMRIRSVPPRRSGELPLLGQRHLLRRRSGLLRPGVGPALQLCRRLRRADPAVAPLHHDPGLERLPPRRAVARARPAYHRGDPSAEPYPLWIEPERKLSVADVMALMRDHYEGTDYDMTKGVDAGPYQTPNRWRPMTWTVDGAEYSWERPISTQQTGFSFVSQSRSWLPDAIGGVYWYGVDDTYTSSTSRSTPGSPESPSRSRSAGSTASRGTRPGGSSTSSPTSPTSSTPS